MTSAAYLEAGALQVAPSRRIDSLRRIAALLDRAEQRVRDRFLELVGASRRVADLERIATLLEQRRLSEAFAFTDRVGDGIATALEQAYVAAGLSAAEVMRSQTGSLLDFNALNERARATMQGRRAALVREWTTQQREAMTDVLADGVRRGVAPQRIAREIRDSVGLTTRQTRSVARFRQLLTEQTPGALNEALVRELRDRRFDQTLARVARGDATLTPQQIERMVERYRENWIQFRAQTIAQTEARAAVEQGDEEMWRQAVESGEISRENVVQVWRTVGDSAVRDSHASMDGQTRALGEPFVSGSGAELAYPGDPSAPAEETINCRCVVAREVVASAAAARRAA